jgi:hypothetical protein
MARILTIGRSVCSVRKSLSISYIIYGPVTRKAIFRSFLQSLVCVVRAGEEQVGYGNRLRWYLSCYIISEVITKRLHLLSQSKPNLQQPQTHVYDLCHVSLLLMAK